MGNSRYAIDTRFELAQLTGAVLLVTILGLFTGGFYYSQNPQLDEQINARFSEKPSYNGDQPVTFTYNQIFDEQSGVNEVYRDTDEEFGWCLEIRNGKVTELNHPRELDKITEESIAFRCQKFDDINGILHTHPGLLARPTLSQKDKEVIQEASELKISCVVSDPVPVTELQKPSTLNCFNSDLERVEVRIERGESLG